ncbi:Glu/Leu/Phe/Val dehydrogenase dimerization domain-containing protein [Balneolaceae bacterium ANBcel3]|nr:Glu/Leu/Phe/Val dehydrogenase dimerization domain-containing protein [Balneolaceae bacterium ANBcel3]
MSLSSELTQNPSDDSIFSSLTSSEHEQIVFCSDNRTDLKAIIAIHNTVLGPSLGGVRMWPYASETEAVHDVLRLSKGMTYKASVAGLQLGGGKAVIIGDPKKIKNEALLRTFGRYVESLAGRYITAQDVGVHVHDMEWIRQETKYVTGLPRRLGGSGDPSPMTAYGVLMGIKAAINKHTGSDSLENKTIAIQGAGKVSSHLVKFLYEEQARVIVSDLDQDKADSLAKTYGAECIEPDRIVSAEADVFCPCALGGILNSITIPLIKAPIIAGAANNQLKDEQEHGSMLVDRDIIYVPDFVINAGGLINVASELEGYDESHARGQITKIYDIIHHILDLASDKQLPTWAAANEIAEDRLQNTRHIHAMYTPSSHFSGRLGELYSRK